MGVPKEKIEELADILLHDPDPDDEDTEDVEALTDEVHEEVEEEVRPRAKGNHRNAESQRDGPSGSVLDRLFAELRKYPLLTPEDEVRLGTIIRASEDKLKKPREQLHLLKKKCRKAKVRDEMEEAIELGACLESLEGEILATPFSALAKELELRRRPLRARFAKLKPEIKKLYAELRELEGTVAALENNPERLAAIHEMEMSNIRLIVSKAKKFARASNEPLADLIHDGMFGLHRGVLDFDPKRGYRFSTYGSWWIRHGIARSLDDRGRLVRLPVHMNDWYYRVNGAINHLTQALGRQPSSEEIAIEMQEQTREKQEYRARQNRKDPPPKKSKKELADERKRLAARVDSTEKYRATAYPLSLDAEIRGDGDGETISTYMDQTADTRKALKPDALPVEDRRAAVVMKLLAALKPIEADIIRRRFLLLNPDPRETGDDMPLTLEEIGEQYDLSRERIRQLEELALKKMARAITNGRIRMGRGRVSEDDVRGLFTEPSAED